MKLVLTLAAIIALGFVFNTARAVEDPPETHVQLVELEQMTPYLESSPGVTAGTATTSIIRKVTGVTFSGQAYAQLDNHNGDGSRGSFPLEVEDGDTYGITATFVKGPTFGVVQVAVDGVPIGDPYDSYAAATAVSQPVVLGVRALAEGKHVLTMTVVGKNAASTDWVGGIDLVTLDSTLAPVATPTAVATSEVGAVVPATLGLTLGTAPTFGPFQPGVAREYVATTTATVVSTAGDATLTSSDPGHLMNGSFALAQPLRVGISPSTWGGPVSNAVATITFTQAIGSGDPLRSGSYTKALTFTVSTTNP